MEEKKVLFHLEQHIATITLNRTNALNALDNDMISDIIHYLKGCNNNDEVRVMVIKGNGKAFCSGDDLVDMGTKDHPNPSNKFTEYIQGYPEIVKAIWDLEKPVITQVHKYALGAGFEIALASDFIIASEESKFGLPFVLRGLAAGTYLLPKMIGYHQAAKILFTGEMITVNELESYGLLYRITTSEELNNEVSLLAEKLANSATRSISLMKRAMHNSADLALHEAMDMQALSTFASFYTDDYQEGIQAFVEKREPNFKGK